jgi:hypothetical protein
VLLTQLRRVRSRLLACRRRKHRDAILRALTPSDEDRMASKSCPSHEGTEAHFSRATELANSILASRRLRSGPPRASPDSARRRTPVTARSVSIVLLTAPVCTDAARKPPPRDSALTSPETTPDPHLKCIPHCSASMTAVESRRHRDGATSRAEPWLFTLAARRTRRRTKEVLAIL